MTASNRTSTPSRAARSRALTSGRTLNPITMALSMVARSMSLSVMAPTPRWRIRSCTESSTSISIASLNVGAHVESDNNGVVDGGEVDVALRDGPHTTVEDTQLHRVIHLDLEESLFQRLDGTGHITLDNEVECFDLALFERAGKVFEGDALASLRELCVTLRGFSLFSNLASSTVFVSDEEDITGTRDTRQTLHLNGP